MCLLPLRIFHLHMGAPKKMRGRWGGGGVEGGRILKMKNTVQHVLDYNGFKV
jgi:hypothetical protein